MSVASANKIFQTIMKVKGFNRVIQGSAITEISPNSLQVTVPVTEDKCNMMSTLHGGFTATMVDILTTFDLIRQGHPSGVSVELNVQFLSAAPLNSTVLFESRLLRVGKKLVFAEVDIKDQASNKLLAKGKHIKYILQN